MKTIIIIFISALSFQVLSQDFFSITVDNQHPRVGDIVKLSFEKDPFKLELEMQVPAGVIVTSGKDIFGMGNENLSKSLEFSTPGNYTIGPFIFEINDQIFITDSVKLEVEAKLPYEPGVWVRYYEKEGERYLVVEQYIQNESDYKKTKKGSSHTIGGVTKDEFATLESNPQKGVSVLNSGSMSTTRRPDGADMFAPGLSYSRKTYKLKFDKEFNGTFKLKKEHFENYPSRTDLTPILIQL